MSKVKGGTLEKKYRDSFAGGWNAYLGARQIKDEESPDLNNMDFSGKGGVCNRSGYVQIGTAGSTYNHGVKGMGEFHTASYHQLLKFVSDDSNVYLSTSTDGAGWSDVTTFGFVNKNIDVCQAGSKIYTGNGSDAMKEWNGATWASTANGTQGYYPTYYNQRLWVVDETNPDRINFSGQYSEQLLTGGSLVSKLGDFADATAGWISFKFGSGAEVTGLKVFKNALYVFLRDSIYSITPATADNTFTIALVTSSLGCISHRSIAQVEEDLYFASNDGVYSLGDVANYTAVRTTNKSAKIQQLFTALDPERRAELVGSYYNFKYHLFYSKGGVTNDSCVAYDIRYGGWLPWSNIAANSAVLYHDSTGAETLNFGHPTTSAVYEMYSGGDDDGAVISSYFYTKSFDEGLPDIQKVYFDHTFIFGAMNGTVTMTAIFNDSQVLGTKSISQANPIGGMGRDEMGRQPFGRVTGGSTTVTNYVGLPLRMRVSKKKFAVQYKISSSGTWQLDGITTTFKPLSHYAFPSTLKI